MYRRYSHFVYLKIEYFCEHIFYNTVRSECLENFILHLKYTIRNEKKDHFFHSLLPTKGNNINTNRQFQINSVSVIMGIYKY